MHLVVALYKFAPFPDPEALQGPLKALCEAENLCGSLLLAPEGINGTVAGSRAGIDALIDHIRRLPGCADLDWKESHSETRPFRRMKVRLKREIVTMGVGGVDPTASVGTYVAPTEWNALIEAPDVAVIDTRNDYEVAVGTFAGAIDPSTSSFGQFPSWWEANKERFHNKRIAMFCTGGIRCEKSTNYLRSQGVEEVYHLQGGILKYLEEVPAEESRWTGECYVFDQRVSVGHGLAPGNYTLCHACGRPVAPEERAKAEYEEGVQCPACVDEYSPEDRARFRERQRQLSLQRARKGTGQ